MRLEYLPDGAPDCPLIRLYDFDRRAVATLRNLVAELADGSRSEILVHELPSIEPLNGCQLALELGKRDLGVIPGQRPNSFRCVLTDSTWEGVAELIEPFCESQQIAGFQWLSHDGRISLLLSTDGQW